MTQVFSPAVNVGNSQSLNLEAVANSGSSLAADDMSALSEAMWSELNSESELWPPDC